MTLSTENDRRSGGGRGALLAIASLVLLLLAGMGYLGLQMLERLDRIEEQVTDSNTKASEAQAASERALARALQAEESARAAAAGRLLAEAESARAREEAEHAESEATRARSDAASARHEAAEARAEAERIRAEAEAELDRLEEALGQIADTRRTALGLVMNLGEDALKFDFDKAELRPENRELLSRIAGILMTSTDYTVSVNGHTDDVGTQEYNQKLSERRAQAVYDYLHEAGLPAEIMTVKGWGKTKPLVPGKSEQARAKNRRVELGIVNARILYPSSASRH